MDSYLIVINYFTGDNEMKAEHEETAADSFMYVVWVAIYVALIMLSMKWFVFN